VGKHTRKDTVVLLVNVFHDPDYEEELSANELPMLAVRLGSLQMSLAFYAREVALMSDHLGEIKMFQAGNRADMWKYRIRYAAEAIPTMIPELGQISLFHNNRDIVLSVYHLLSNSLPVPRVAEQDRLREIEERISKRNSWGSWDTFVGDKRVEPDRSFYHVLARSIPLFDHDNQDFAVSLLKETVEDFITHDLEAIASYGQYIRRVDFQEN
jgi:hypothetical protein